MTPETTPAHATAEIRIDPAHRTGRVAPEVFGHFLESAFFGNIEGGVFDEGHALAVDGPGVREGLRSDVIELCRKLGTPVVRWPGGNFTSPYRWEDGIGPRDQRPRRLELAWGSEETNRFGTDEFLAWCEEVGAEAYLAHSARDVDDAVRWVEYTNYAGDTHYSRLRARNGHPDPYRVRYWGVGNEVYGRWQMGHRDATTHARDAREHALFMRHVDPSIRTIGVGDHTDENWNAELLAHAGNHLDYLSIHLYGASTHLDPRSDAATEYDQVVAQAAFFERHLSDYSALIAEQAAQAGIDRPLGLALDEWNVRHLEPDTWPEPQAGADGGIAEREAITDDSTPQARRVSRYSPRTLADALCYAGVFHAIHRLAGSAVPVTMANPVNLVNANGIVVARPGGAFGSALYPVWDLYQNHLGPITVASVVDGPGRSADIRQGDEHRADGSFVTRPGTVADLDVAATLDEDGATLRVAVINRHRTRSVRTRLVVAGSSILPTATMRRLGVADEESDPMAVNLLDSPDTVSLRDLGEQHLPDGQVTFAAGSVTVLTLPMR